MHSTGDIALTLQFSQEGPNEQQKSDKTGDRVAREADEMYLVSHNSSVDLPVRKRFARLHADAPQIQATQLLHGRFDVVFFTHAHAAAGQDQVVVLRGGLQCFNRRSAVVGHDA